jgi:phosphoglycerate kinase
VPGGSKVLDIGPKTRKEFAGKINGAETVLLCGPLGVCEVPEFSKGTGETAMALAQASAFTAAMGTRTVSTLDALGIKEKKEGDAEGMDFISRGGDASIEYIVTGTLPAVYAIRECIK